MFDAFQIEFDYIIQNIPRIIHLTASVEIRESKGSYTITNIATRSKKVVLPNQEIKKVTDIWMNMEFNRSTYLTSIIGRAIDRELSK